MHLAGLGWRVSKRRDSSGSLFLVREDIVNHGGAVILGDVRPDFIPLQNSEAFSLLDPMIESGAFSVDSAGSWAKGEWVWMMLRSSHDQEITPGDAIRPFLLFGHTPRNAQYRLAYVLVRLINLSVLIEEAFHNPEPVATVPSVRPRRFRESDQTALNQIHRHLTMLTSRYREMSKTALSEGQAEEYFASVSECLQGRSSEEEKPLRSNQPAVFRIACMEQFRRELKTRPSGGQGTLWTAYCAVVEYIDSEISTLEGWKYLQELWFNPIKGGALRIAIKKLQEDSQQ